MLTLMSWCGVANVLKSMYLNLFMEGWIVVKICKRIVGVLSFAGRGWGMGAWGGWDSRGGRKPRCLGNDGPPGGAHRFSNPTATNKASISGEQQPPVV